LRKRNPAPLGPGQREPILDESVEPRPWEEVFGRKAPIEVDVGFGKGEFLLKLSAYHPEVDYVGIDYNRQRVFKLRDKLVRLERRNVRLVFGNSGVLVPRLFKAGEVRAFTVNFPDPWPKRRHHKRRLITPGFGEILAGRLAPGGTLTLATDFEPYAEEIIQVLAEVKALVPEFEPPGFVTALPGRVETLYERKYHEAGRTNRYMRYSRKA
jgi:tRNA (guanine-N7-)-methyltransferase